MITQQKFPKDFLWGGSTAAHQVEGGTRNQWSVWELSHATDMAASAEKRLGWLREWQELKDQASDPENYVSGKGVDHYNRYEEDFELLKKLQLNSMRFGIEWSRINPEEGVWDKEAVAHYHRYIDGLRLRGITPVMNLWHYTMPTWFADKGGFEKRENLVYFDQFVAKIAEEYADKVEYVLTLNEPNVYASFSYLTGEWPPQITKPLLAFKVYRNLYHAHNRAYTILKQRRSTLKVGLAMQLGNIQAKRPHNILDGLATKVMRYSWNWWFLNRCKRHQDFIGINYYFTDYYKGLSFKKPDNAGTQGNDVDVPVARRFNPSVPVSDMGFYMEPEGIYPLMLRVWARYKKPIMITENGVADRNDAYRQWWLEQTIIAMQRALSENVPVIGYMHWSLLDNFEWAFGWWPKFGLVAVDRDNNMQRTVRPSAIWLARYLRSLQDGEKPKPNVPAESVEQVVAAASPITTAPSPKPPTAPKRPLATAPKPVAKPRQTAAAPRVATPLSQPPTPTPTVAPIAPTPSTAPTVTTAPMMPKRPSVFNRLKPSKRRPGGRGPLV